MLIGNDFFVLLYTRLPVNKRFQVLYIFIEIKVVVWLICAQTLMTSITFDTGRPNSIKH